MFISDTVKYVGVNDHRIDLFEGQYPVPNGMAYNSYLILDEKTAVMDSVDIRFTHEWLEKIRGELGDRSPDYLVVQHMEPDHSGSIRLFMEAFPQTRVVSSAKAFTMMGNFFGTDFAHRRVVVGEGDTLSLGSRTLSFVTAPMVHWPEVIMTYDSGDKLLFSADAFGKFGALDAEEPWVDEARRYYIGIVGKFGGPVQTLLKKAAKLDIGAICPLHGPVLKEDLGKYLELYQTWSSYRAEEEGILIAYTSIYGNTKTAVEALADRLTARGERVTVLDLARCDMFHAVAEAFRYSKLVLATTTYNGDIFPFMRTFIDHLTARGFANRTVALVENGSWSPTAAKVMGDMLAKCKNLHILPTTLRILSALNDESRGQLEQLAEELIRIPDAQTPPEEKPAGGKKFICKICGYIYEGESLPADYICPLCRKGAEVFEELPQEPEVQVKKFVCKICGYIYEGESLPADYICPLCRKGAEIFEELP